MGKGRGVWGQGLMEYTPPFPVSPSVEGAPGGISLWLLLSGQQVGGWQGAVSLRPSL